VALGVHGPRDIECGARPCERDRGVSAGARSEDEEGGEESDTSSLTLMVRLPRPHDDAPRREFDDYEQGSSRRGRSLVLAELFTFQLLGEQSAAVVIAPGEVRQ